jgi:hypothetical protein
MASPEELIPSLPDTLPEDFGEWDSEGSAAATAVASDEWETAHTVSEAPEMVTLVRTVRCQAGKRSEQWERSSSDGQDPQLARGMGGVDRISFVQRDSEAVCENRSAR